MWIESHPELEHHPKLLHFQRLLNIGVDEALGKIHRLWYWTTKYAPDGDLQKYGLEHINMLLGLPANSRALVETGFIDMQERTQKHARCIFRVHDWWDYCGRYFKLKYRNQPEKAIQMERKCTSPIQTRSKRSLDGRYSAPSSLPTSPSLPAFPAKAEEKAVFKNGGGKKKANGHPESCACEGCWKLIHAQVSRV